MHSHGGVKWEVPLRPFSGTEPSRCIATADENVKRTYNTGTHDNATIDPVLTEIAADLITY